ncbi:uncharacterized protein LOC124170212 [Ischnura elegans]|uniref:uncharacterized protein LOC124170212 n=1 Tax=Ischnura elegans TaxID=197161 RepID=UPI001ED8B2E3|nr:uncharacterized protein LOC124170212 [Ischnura elegans]
MARVEKNYFVMATCKAFLEANIPIEKVDNLSLRSWMSEYIPGAGDLPSADMMRKTYIPQVREEEEAFMRQKVKDQQVSILCDETTDRKGQCVFLVLIKILECSDSSKLYVGGAKILSNANATECGRAIMDDVQVGNFFNKCFLYRY